MLKGGDTKAALAHGVPQALKALKSHSRLNFKSPARFSVFQLAGSSDDETSFCYSYL